MGKMVVWIIDYQYEKAGDMDLLIRETQRF
jgi:hypothetical protein